MFASEVRMRVCECAKLATMLAEGTIRVGPEAAIACWPPIEPSIERPCPAPRRAVPLPLPLPAGHAGAGAGAGIRLRAREVAAAALVRGAAAATDRRVPAWCRRGTSLSPRLAAVAAGTMLCVPAPAPAPAPATKAPSPRAEGLLGKAALASNSSLGLACSAACTEDTFANWIGKAAAPPRRSARAAGCATTRRTCPGTLPATARGRRTERSARCCGGCGSSCCRP